MNEFKNLKDVPSLIAFLEEKGSNHNCYYHYTTWDSFSKIYKNKSFLLTRGNSLAINDQHEAIMKGSWEIWNKTYIGSFAFGSAENMAMWGLYGLPWEDAIRISILKEEMLNWLKNLSSVSPWDGDTKGEIKNAKISLTDIVYIDGSRGANNVRLTHKDKSFTINRTKDLCGVDENPKMTGYIKNYAWHYENEVRIRVELPQDVGYEKILLNIPEEIISSMRVTTGPYFKWRNDELYDSLYSEGKITESSFKNLVHYKALCSMCQHKEFARK